MVRLNDQDQAGGVRIYKSRNLMVRLNAGRDNEPPNDLQK